MATSSQELDSHVTGTGTVALNSGNDTSLKGAVVTGETVIANVGGDLAIESQQDASRYREKSTSVSGGISSSGVTVGANRSTVKGDFANVAEQSGIVAGAGGYHVAVGSGVDLKAGVIASSAEKDKNSLSADHLTYSNLDNVSKASSSGFGLSVGIGFDGKVSIPTPSVSQPAKEEDTGRALATLTPGTLNLDNQQQDLSGLNTDLGKANTTVTPYDIDRLKAKQESAAALSELLNGLAGDLSKELGFKDGSPEKTALHAAVGALTAVVSGNNAGLGALAGGSQELVGAVIGQALLDNPNLSQEERDALSKWAAIVVGSVVGGSAGAATALDAESFNRQLHIDEARLIGANAARYAVERGICPSVSECPKSAIDLAIADLTTQAIKQIDASGRDLPQNDAAAAFLDEIAPKGSIPAVCNPGSTSCVQQWFHASGDTYSDPTINWIYFKDAAQYYNLASELYNREHVNQIGIGGDLLRSAKATTAVREAASAVDKALLPWEVFNGVFMAAAGDGPFRYRNQVPEKEPTAIEPGAYSGGKGGGPAGQSGAPNAANRTVTEFVSGVTVVDRKTGTTFTGIVDLRPTLDRIQSGGKSSVGRNDGTVFQNKPVLGKTQPELPIQPQGYYTEYVHPTPGVSGPGPQRIVTGAGGEIYYTPDHYATFIRLDH